MKFIAHRINTVSQLKDVPVDYGVEVDIRDQEDRLILQHDPFRNGEPFESFLNNYRHGILILNIKSERIELKVIELLRRYQIMHYFFLDSSFPMIYQLTQHGEQNIAVRFSELESIGTVEALAGRVRWVWVDCFTKLPITPGDYTKLKRMGYNLCLVSPELHGREEDIEVYRDYLRNNCIKFDAICTKLNNIDRWRQ